MPVTIFFIFRDERRSIKVLGWNFRIKSERKWYKTKLIFLSAVGGGERLFRLCVPNAPSEGGVGGRNLFLAAGKKLFSQLFRNDGKSSKQTKNMGKNNDSQELFTKLANGQTINIDLTEER